MSQGKREPPHHYIEKINAVTMGDIKKVAEKMLSSKPAVAAIGTLKNLPEFNDIQVWPLLQCILFKFSIRKKSFISLILKGLVD